LRRLHYAWIIAVISAAILVMQGILLQTFGVFVVPLTEQFNWGRGALSGAPSVAFLLMGFLGIFTGILSDKYGPRALVTLAGLLVGAGLLLMSLVNSLWQVYLVWGLFIGVGSSCYLTPLMSTVPKWFEEKRGMALGIAAAGMGVGGIIFPLLAQWFISSYDWRRSFFILGLIAFIIVIPVARLLKQSPQQMGLRPYGADRTIKDGQSPALTSGLSISQAIRTGRFWIFTPIHACFLFSMQIIYVHIVPYAEDMGIVPMAAASVASVIGVSTIIGNLFMGFIADKIGSRLAFSLCLVLAVLALAWLLFAEEIWGFYLFALVFGLAVGGTNALATMVTAELFGLKYLGLLLGIVMLAGTVGGALGAPLAGVIFDITKGYSLAFSICIILCVMAIILSVILLKCKVERDEA
jgi:MFS family permease